MIKKSVEERIKSLKENLKNTSQIILALQQYMQKIENEVAELEKQIAEDKKFERENHDRFMESKMVRELPSAQRRKISAGTTNEIRAPQINSNAEITSRPVLRKRITTNIVTANSAAAVNTVTNSSIANSERNFLSEYNNILSETDGYKKKIAREEFIKKYNVRAFSCTNYNEKMNKPSLAAIFEEISPLSVGDYWAIQISENIFKVVPNVKAYNENLHVARAMVEVFDSNFDSGTETYVKIYVDTAAEFTNSGQNWNLVKKGRITLG